MGLSVSGLKKDCWEDVVQNKGLKNGMMLRWGDEGREDFHTEVL